MYMEYRDLKGLLNIYIYIHPSKKEIFHDLYSSQSMKSFNHKLLSAFFDSLYRGQPIQIFSFSLTVKTINF